MEKVTAGLKYYVQDRLARDPGWRGIKVVLTTAAVPGEGEHKIMDFIRRQRLSPGYDPNTRHCIYGLDADLIMLSLATHEPHFTILREVVVFGGRGGGGAGGNGEGCFRCGQHGHKAAECPNPPSASPQSQSPPPAGSPEVAPSSTGGRKPFQFLRTSVLREYLEHSFGRDLQPRPAMVQPGMAMMPAMQPQPPTASAPLPFAFDIDNLIDDWVFLCFFVGNDFLPHMPTLEIREGAIDKLTTIYKQVLPTLGGYITHDGEVNVQRALEVLKELARLEDTILQRRRRDEQRRRLSQQAMERRVSEQQQQRYEQLQAMNALPIGQHHHHHHHRSSDEEETDGHHHHHHRSHSGDRHSDQEQQHVAVSKVDSDMSPDEMNFTAARALQGALASSPHLPSTAAPPVPVPLTPAMASTGTTPAPSEPEDNVRLGEQGWHERYYSAKFGQDLADTNGQSFCKRLCESYMQGLIWVLRYYYQGCCSWTWFYPFHYSPFAIDLVRYIDPRAFVPQFELGQPFRPFDQLMGVLPGASAHALPAPYRELMTSPTSPIADFYPLEFAIDLNGKKFAWQGVAILPFIDERRLLDALATCEPLLTEEERRRDRKSVV